MKNEEKSAYEFDYPAKESDYTPAALRQAGRALNLSLAA